MTDHAMIEFRETYWLFEIRKDGPYLAHYSGSADIALRSISQLAELAGVPESVVEAWILDGRIEAVDVTGVVFVAGNGDYRQVRLMPLGTYRPPVTP